MIEKHRINCFKLFDYILNNPTDVDFANFFYILFGNIAVSVNVKQKLWYFYENQLWNDDVKQSYRTLIEKQIVPIFLNYTKVLYDLKEKNEGDIDDELEKDFQIYCFRAKQITDRLKKTTDRNNICLETQIMCFKRVFIKI